MKRLTGLDAAFLYMETPTTHLHVGGLGIFEPTGESPESVYERTLQLCEQRLHLSPVFRQRLVSIPLQIHHPVLVDDPDFDLRFHVRRMALPAPGGPRELGDVVGDIMSRPLDRNRPLWELYLIEGLEDGGFASVTKMHHAIVDGISGVELAMLLLDMEQEPPQPTEPPPPFEPERIPTDGELLAYGLASRLRQPLGAVKVARSLGRQARELVSQQTRPRQPDLNPPPAPFTAPNTSLNGSISPHRCYSFTSVALDDLRRIKDAYGCKLNDVVLAVCSGALRAYFDEEGEELDSSLVASVPVSVRTDDQSGALGNQVTGMLVSLATDVDDPVERLGTIAANSRGAKEGLEAGGADALTDLVEVAPPNLMIQAARLISRTRIADAARPVFNFTISNVPGPPFPVYSLGAKMTLMSPLGPVADSSALNITVASYDGAMTFGFQACSSSVEDVWFFERAVRDAAAELLKTVDAPS